jgi:hypothetical protein
VTFLFLFPEDCVAALRLEPFRNNLLSLPLTLTEQSQFFEGENSVTLL